ncbi:MAG: HD domain-containing protein, partial [Marmoricola sp.]
MTAAGREQRTRAADAACAAAYDATGCPGAEVALVAVGGYGRAELAPYSDLDLVLVHDAGTEPGEWAGRVWYPLWDGGFDVDHAVRSVEGMLEQARSDPRTALGMLDVRHVAGDTNLTLRLRSAVLTAWRREARSGLGDLRRTVQDRATLLGELAHAAVPDLKESLGGLRDATVLKALVASWLVDVPHAELEGCRQALLDVRDAQHRVAGRATDRVLPEYWSGIADELGVADAAAAQRHVRGLGRRLTHLSRLTWRRVEEVTRPRSPTGPRRPRLERVAPGVAVSHGEVVLERAGGPADPALVVRAAAEAAERGLVLAPTTAARLGRAAPLASPWPAPLRRDFVRLLAAGPGMLAVWETLDETGALQVLLPEWESVRLLPHASAVHRFTVDRHLVETCIEAAGLVRGVSRPDVLVVASLLHDIGKGGPDEHSRAGEPIARRIAARMGFAPREVGLVVTLVRRHLLLPETATMRDLRDPATLRSVVSRV